MSAPREKLDPSVVALGVVSLFTDVASDMVIPLLPVFMTTVLHASLATVGLADGAADAIASLLRIVSGRLSDRATTRKPLVVLGYGVTAAVRPFLGLAAAPWHVVALRMTDRVGKGMRAAPRDAWIAQVTTPALRGRAFGLHAAMDNLGGFLGPLVALLLHDVLGLTLRQVFVAAAVPGALSVLVLVLVRERPALASTPTTDATPQARAPLPPALRAFLGALFVFTLANASDAFFITWAHTILHAPDWAILVGWTSFTGLRALLSQPGSLLSDRIGRRACLLLGWTTFALAYLATSFATHWPPFCGVLALYAVYYGLTEGAEKALVADLAPASARGWAFGLFHGTIGLAALPASLGFGAIADHWGMPVAFRVSAALAVVAALGLAALLSAQRSAGRDR